MGLDILRGCDVNTVSFVEGNTRAVDAGSKSGCHEAFEPGLYVCLVGFGKPAALFQIQENYRARRKSFSLRQCRGALCVLASLSARGLSVLDFA